MLNFELHTEANAPEGSGPLLEKVREKFGFAPNLTRVLAEAPATLEAYLTLGGLVERTSLSAHEQEVVILSTSFENGCEYCMAAHTAVAGMKKLPSEVVAALRSGTELPDARLNALSQFTREVVRERGRVSPDGIRAFLSAGFERRHVLEVLVAVTMKTLSNYTNHLAETPLDEAFAPHAWDAPALASKS